MLCSQEHLGLCNDSQGDAMTNFLEAFGESDQRQLFEAMQNVVILHQYQLSCDFELLMSEEVGNWVKAWNMTLYSYFLMTQYGNWKWVE